ncbi:TonB-dependent receptor plug domain-containing protein [Flavobacterium sp. W21_SRS_FM6]|uniref:TonB-dependent receptor plug domain-containing protein n=1 Tax=Flavobacterium sp. W21_SRS_FM6 TaxID=3240268 RepID=UPI003F8E0C9E
MRHVFYILLLFSSYVSAEGVYQFNIPAQQADKALTLFAKQANTTLLFPIDIAELETANSVVGEYSLTIGIVKLLEGTGLYPVKEQDGSFSVKPIRFVEVQTKESAQSVQQTEFVDTQSIETIAILGSRSSARSIIDSAVPLDILNVEKLTRQGSTDINSMLAALVPSFNVNDQPINDASTLVRPSNLRGMASDHTLVLINGKRRHRSAAITFLGGALSDGAQGVDLSTIPVSSIKQVEILRDGAAAQYGSDAIAGVINFELNDSDAGGRFEARIGSYGQGDGELLQLLGDVGFSLNDKGFAHISAEYKQQEATSNSVQRSDAAALINAGNTAVNTPAQQWGIPTLHYDAKFAANVGYQLDEKELYLFTNTSERRIEGGFYFRNPQTRQGVFESEPDSSGMHQLLVADLDGLGQGISCPIIYLADDNVLDDANYGLIADNTTAVGANCFAFNEIYPGGFTPQFGGTVRDGAMVAGLKGQTTDNWNYDLSAGLGYSEISYHISQTVNPSLGIYSPSEFSPGTATQYERTLNFDVFKPYELNDDAMLTIAAGLEWRRERYRQKVGDLASYQIGQFAYDPATGLSQGFSAGSNGFPGYSPKSAGSWQRSNWAIYSDAELKYQQTLLGLAMRFEDFTDFGTTLDGKFSLLTPINDRVKVRGSISSGFKAPTVGQSNVVNVTTAFSPKGLEDQSTLPPTHPISAQLGAQPLKAEKSINTSLGLVSQPTENLFITLDYFRIRLNDRISTTSPLYLSSDDIASLLANGITEASNYGSAKFFTNDFDSTTQGIDLVMHYDTTLLGARSRVGLIYNWTDTQIDRVNTYPLTAENGEIILSSNLTPQRIKMLEDNLPSQRASVTLEQSFKQFSSNLQLNYYGGYYEDHLNAAAGYDIEAGSEITLDVDLSYYLHRHFRLSVGAKNLFDDRADSNPYADVAGAKYPATAPQGLSGGFYYLRAIYEY